MNGPEGSGPRGNARCTEVANSENTINRVGHENVNWRRPAYITSSGSRLRTWCANSKAGKFIIVWN